VNRRENRPIHGIFCVLGGYADVHWLPWYQMAVSPRFMRFEPTPIDRDVLMLPEIMVDCAAPVEKLMRPKIDLAWNECGWEERPNFDAAGHWMPR
jgi:hypothetical protein